VRTRRGAIDDTLFRRRGKKVWAATQLAHLDDAAHGTIDRSLTSH
jgi:hypothetical protein